MESLAAIYTALNFSAGLVTFGLSLYIIQKQGWTNSLTFVLLLWAGTLNSLTNGFMIVSRSPEIASYLENFRWFSLSALPPLMLIFILDFTGRDQRITPGWLMIYFAIPLITQLVVWTNHLHHFMIQNGYDEFLQIGIYLLPGERIFGTWFWFYAIWGYLLILVSVFILIYDTFSTPQLEWPQFIWLIIGFITPIIFSVIDTFKLLEPSWFKLLPFGFMLMSIAFFSAIIRGQFVNIIPKARSYLIETLQDAVIMVDRNHQIVDINPIASLLIEKNKKMLLGKPAREALQFWPRLAHLFLEQNEISTMVKVVKDVKGRSYDTHIAPLRTRQKKSSGWVIVLHDITQLKDAQTRASQLASVIEQAQETILITNKNGNITYANPYFEETTGFTVEEALGQNPNILQSGIQTKNFYADLWETITSGEAWGGNFINKRKDGSLYHEAATIFPIKNEEGEIINYAAVKRDITAQVNADAALRNFSEKLESLHEISLKLSQAKTFDELTYSAVTLWREKLQFDRIGIWFLDLKNPELLQGSFGIDEQGNIRDERAQRMEIGNDPVHNLLLENSPRLYYNPQNKLRNHKAEVIGIGEAAASALWDGQQVIGYIAIDNLLSKQPISSYQREILALFAQTLGNLTTRIRSQESIEESERQYRLLADNATDVIWSMDLDGTFTYVSPAVEQMRGYTPEEVLEQTLDEVLTPESLFITNEALATLEKNIRNGEPIDPLTIELEQKCKDGTIVLTESTISVVFDEDPQGIKLLGVTRDITERKKTERKVQRFARYQELLNEITQAAIQQSDFDEMIQVLADRMGDLLNADGCYITLWDEKTQTITPAAAYGPLRDKYRVSIQPQHGESTLTESALMREEVLVIENVFDSPYLSKRIASKFPTRSGIALPLIANNQKLGAALIAFNHERQYSQAEIEISKQAAQQIALAILKNRLLEEAQQRAKEADTLRLASTAIVTTLEQEQAIERILEELNRVVPYDSASVLLVKGTDMEIVGARGFRNPGQILNISFPLTENSPNKVVFETRKPYILYDAQEIYRAFQETPHNHIHGWMGIPLLIREQFIGMLALDSHQPGQFTQDHARLASAFADQVAIALENTRLFEETRRLAITDSLTELFNRRHFMDLARREFERSNRYKVPLSIIMLDIDHFKKVNDTFGHLAGDQVLQIAAFICRKNLRSIDFIGRFGGEEFIILLPETSLFGCEQSDDPDCIETLPAKTVAERIRKTIAKQSFEIGQNSIKITVSLGVAERLPTDQSIENVIDYADQALLQAKNRGRNQIFVWKPEENLAQD